MANTIKTTNRTIEVSAIDEDYMMPVGINVDSVVFLPGAAADLVYIIESSIETTDPVKVLLESGDNEPRGWLFGNQRLRLGFTFADGTFTATSKVIFNIGERGY
jgi:hypothetical protein